MGATVEKREPADLSERMRVLQRAPVRPDGRYVLYWMTAARRTRWNCALDHAIGMARELDRPLLVLEALRCDYPFASDRLHAFVLQGMRDNDAAFEKARVRYHPFVERRPGEGKGLLDALAREACTVVTDDFPAFFLPRMIAAAASRLDVRVEAVDSNGLLPMRSAPRVFARAYDFRRFLQRNLAKHLHAPPRSEPLRGRHLPLESLPEGIEARWPAADERLLRAEPAALAALPIDHEVGVVDIRGGAVAGRRQLERFVSERLEKYDAERNQPDERMTSGLSPYLHFGHVAAHDVLDAIADREDWTPDDFGGTKNGSREGWWGTSPDAEAFLDQLVTWRELGLNMAAHREDYDRYESLPDWARKTLAEHADDERPYLYDLEQLCAADTHDELWNAAQNELVESGRMHNYLRMLWGKKILHWTESPRRALEIMLELNNRYALDGRDPNSYSGIFWVLGRYDRAWGPERPVFGKIRYMSSRNTRRKLRLGGYLERWERVGGDLSAGAERSACSPRRSR